MKIKAIIVEHEKGISLIKNEDLLELEEAINEEILPGYEKIFESRFEAGLDQYEEPHSMVFPPKSMIDIAVMTPCMLKWVKLGFCPSCSAILTDKIISCENRILYCKTCNKFYILEKK